jgi:hypothetical protein
MFLAYKYVFVAAMMSQINEYAPRMHLPITVPVRESEIRFLHVSDPVMLKDFQDHSGRLQVTNYSFTFGLYTRAIINLDEYGFVSFGVPMGAHESSASGMERASREKYVATTNDTYRLATNWLVALDIDIAKLEATNPPRVNTDLFKSNRGWVPSPILEVRWIRPKFPGWDPTGVSVEISAVTGELLKLSDGDGTFRTPKRPLIYDVEELLAIEDKEFKNYTPQQRADLVEKFAHVTGSKDFLTNMPAAFDRKLSRLKPKPGPKGVNHKYRYSPLLGKSVSRRRGSGRILTLDIQDQ